jgi:Icc protein
MSYLNDLPTPFDAVLVTGDIADHGLPAEYEQARTILSSPHAVFTCPGNHDRRRAYAQVLLGQAGGDAPTNEVHRMAGAMFALCDSTIPGRDDGYLADETLGWLDSLLADSSDDTAVFVCFHHPPVILHSPFIDEIGSMANSASPKSSTGTHRSSPFCAGMPTHRRPLPSSDGRCSWRRA